MFGFFLIFFTFCCGDQSCSSKLMTVFLSDKVNLRGTFIRSLRISTVSCAYSKVQLYGDIFVARFLFLSFFNLFFVGQ